MKTALQLLILALAAVLISEFFTKFWRPPQEPVAALEIRDIQLPTQPEKRPGPPPKPEPEPESPPSTAPYPTSTPAPSQPSPAPIAREPAPMMKILPPTPLPQPEPQLAEREIYERFSGAIIQIYCATYEELFSASGVILNERGLVLTNAHVAEIVEKSGQANCQARHGNPADPFGKIEIVYVASTAPKIPGTKVPQRDFAFLKITEAKEPFGAAEIGLAPAKQGETLLTLGYPSEFLQGINTSRSSNLVFSALAVAGYADVDNDLDTAEGYVFKGGLVLQRGSSGTALFNRAGWVVGLIFATTKGETTADRDGIALMTSYIDKILRLETGEGLMSFVNSH